MWLSIIFNYRESGKFSLSQGLHMFSNNSTNNKIYDFHTIANICFLIVFSGELELDKLAVFLSERNNKNLRVS